VKDNTFNADFYIAAATVIPILYLALTLQGSTFEELLTRWKTSLRKVPLSSVWGLTVRLLAFLAFLIAGSIIILAGFVGEYASIVALYRRSATGSAGQFVLISFTGLLLAVLAPPAFKFWAMGHRLVNSLGDDGEELPQPKAKRPPDSSE
jgi:hypothetical protein